VAVSRESEPVVVSDGLSVGEAGGESPRAAAAVLLLPPAVDAVATSRVGEVATFAETPPAPFAPPLLLLALLLLELAELKLLLLVAVADAATSDRAGPESSV